MNKYTMKPIAAAIGTAFAASWSASVAADEANPFAADELRDGYHLFAQEGECGVVDHPGEDHCDHQRDSEGRDTDGKTDLHIAAAEGGREMVELYAKMGKNIDAIDSACATPLHYAVQMEHWEVVRLLIQAGANVEHQDKDGKTPFQYLSPTAPEDIGTSIRSRG